MKRQLLTAGAALLVLSSALPISADAGNTGTFPLQVVAGAIASITVQVNGTGTITCDVGTTLSGIVPCTNQVSVSGSVRSSSHGNATLTVTPPGATVPGSNGSSVPVAALQMTCTDNGSSGMHGTATFASATPSSSSGSPCAVWAGPNAFNPAVTISYGIDAAQVPADTYAPQNWTVTASST